VQGLCVIFNDYFEISVIIKSSKGLGHLHVIGCNRSQFIY